jgi:opacity protein-like surface antigen
MHKRVRCFQVGCLAAFLFVPSAVFAQSEEFHHFTLSAGAGLTTITGADAGKLDHGGNVQLNGGYFFNRYLGITGNFMFSGLGITRTELNSLNVPDGSARVYSLTADPTLRVPLGRGFSAYVLAGGGYMRRTVEFTRPTLAQTIIFDPWWGYFGPALVPANQILGKVTNNSGAFDVGGGLNIPLRSTGVKLFVEARYFKGFTSNTDTTVVPITFGMRW